MKIRNNLERYRENVVRFEKKKKKFFYFQLELCSNRAGKLKGNVCEGQDKETF